MYSIIMALLYNRKEGDDMRSYSLKTFLIIGNFSSLRK